MDNLYMFAIMPPADIEARISEERKDFAAKYNCHKALKPPVHVTICEPFKAPTIAEDIIPQIGKWISRQKPIPLEMRNFNYFNNTQHPVLYIEVLKNDVLKDLSKKFIEQLRKYVKLEANKQAFNPHFTIGYRDVPPAIFPAIMEEYAKRRFHASFLFDTIYFWKHDGSNWQTIQEFKLTQNTSEDIETVQVSLF